MLQEGYIPKSVEEHLKVSLISVGRPIMACVSFVGMNNIATKDCFDWVSSVPRMVQALSKVLRLLDDLQSYEVIIYFNPKLKIWYPSKPNSKIIYNSHF